MGQPVVAIFFDQYFSTRSNVHLPLPAPVGLKTVEWNNRIRSNEQTRPVYFHRYITAVVGYVFSVISAFTFSYHCIIIKNVMEYFFENTMLGNLI